MTDDLKSFIKTYSWAILIGMGVLVLYGPDLSSEWLVRYINQAIPWCLILLGEYVFLLFGNINYAAGGQICFLTAAMAWIGSESLLLSGWFLLVLLIGNALLLGFLCAFLEEKLRMPLLLVTIAFYMVLSGLGGYIREHSPMAGCTEHFYSMNKKQQLIAGCLFLAVMIGILFVVLYVTTIGRRISIMKTGEYQMRKAGIGVLQIKIWGYSLAFLLIGAGAFFYCLKIGGSVNFNSNQVTYDVLTALGIGGIYQINRHNLVWRAMLGSMGLVLLHLLTSAIGLPSAINLCMGGIIILTSFGMGRSSKDCTT